MARPTALSKKETRIQTKKLKPIDGIVIRLSYGFGAGGILLYLVFLGFGPFDMFKVDLHVGTALAVDTILCLFFFTQHSVMARKSVREKLSLVVRPKYTPAVFSIASGITLSITCLFWQETPLIIESRPAIKWMLHSLFLGSVIGLFWGVGSLKFMDPFGRRAILEKPDRPPAKLLIRGPYRFVRHPLYLFSMVMIWSRPTFTADLLLFNMLFTVWFIIGSILEEKDLVREFGKDYKTYQASVPMIFPCKFP